MQWCRISGKLQKKKHQKGGEEVPKQWRSKRVGWYKKRHARAWGVWLLKYPLAGSMAVSIFFRGYVGSAQLGVFSPVGFWLTYEAWQNLTPTQHTSGAKSK